MIQFKDINFNYDENIILSNFNDTFEDNKINCIIGPSGAGKTTLLNLIASLITPKSGSISGISGKVSYVFQEPRLIPQMTVFKNLDYILKNVHPNKIERKNKIIEYLQIVELENELTKYPHELSGGMQQRLSLIRAFLFPSSILLLDEPFKSLDIQLKNTIIKFFLKLWERDQRTVIFVTHEIDEALLIGDNIHIYKDKPISSSNTIQFASSSIRSKLYSQEVQENKKQILLEIEKW